VQVTLAYLARGDAQPLMSYLPDSSLQGLSEDPAVQQATGGLPVNLMVGVSSTKPCGGPLGTDCHRRWLGSLTWGAFQPLGRQWRSSGGAVAEQWRSSGGAVAEQWRSSGGAVAEQQQLAGCLPAWLSGFLQLTQLPHHLAPNTPPLGPQLLPALSALSQSMPDAPPYATAFWALLIVLASLLQAVLAVSRAVLPPNQSVLIMVRRPCPLGQHASKRQNRCLLPSAACVQKAGGLRLLAWSVCPKCCFYSVHTGGVASTGACMPHLTFAPCLLLPPVASRRDAR